MYPTFLFPCKKLISLIMASFVILGSLRGNSSQEIMNNQTDQENHLKLVYEQENEQYNGQMNILFCVLYLSFLITAVIVSIFANNKMKRKEVRIRRRQQRKNLIYFREENQPPSYTKIFFHDDPPNYTEAIFQHNYDSKY